MKLEQASYSVDNVIPLKESVNEYLRHRNHEETPRVTNDHVFGGILSDTRYSWLSCGPRLQVLHTKSGAKAAAWCFRAQHDFETCVTCICDLRNGRGRAPLLVVGLECEITGGMICVFDVGSSRVVRAIQVDDKVTSIEVVSSGGDSGLPGVLRALDGVIAVGTAKGKVFLVDLCRQICEEAISNNSNESIRDEINSCNLINISFEDLRNLESHKEMSLNKGDHLCLQLNEDSTSSVHFSLFGPSGDLRLRANMSEVIVSCLQFSPALGSLLVGFNFGAWQLYHLVATPYPVLAYTSPMYEDCVPVAQFAVQEPCDDPRAFCYVWVVYSIQQVDIVRDSEKDTAMAVMYSLTYGSKEYLEDYGVIYQELEACSIRFQLELANIVPGVGKNTAAKCICLRSYTRQLSAEVPEERLALCAIVWTCWDVANPTAASDTYLALFDLNQWYKEQMPGQPHAQTDRYMVCVNVTELMATHGDVASATDELLDFRLDSSSLCPFTCAQQRLEEHYYPSALAFAGVAACGRRLCWLRSVGSQRHLLAQLELAGPLCLLQPAELYRRGVALGLCVDAPGTAASPTARQQREAVLGAALEHQLVRWLCRCARDWASGAQAAGGCTLDFLLDWAWQRANRLKFSCDRVCVPLFDHTGERLDHNALQQLNHAACQLKHLTTLFDTVLTHCYMYFTQQDIEDIRYQYNSLLMITTYLEVLQWLLNVGLLPECPLSMYPLPDHAERLSAPYPADSLLRFYNKRRAELQDAESSLLFIDQLVARECGGQRLIQEWRGDGGSGWYPPPSLQALLRTYLVEDIEMEYKHCLVIYVFLDLAMTLDQSRYKSIITHLIKFPAVFKLSPSVIKITQAFWHLDHGDFSTAMAQLLDPAVAGEDLKPWHHRTVLKALLVQGQHQHALLYHQVRKPPVSSVQDICVIITLLVVNDLLQEAFHFQRQNRSVYNEKEILKHFFSVSDKISHLANILQLPLSQIEESSFISYLRSHPSDTNENLLVIYFLQRDRYDEAFQANERLNAEFNNVKQGILGQQERNFRNVIVEGFKKTLPDVTQILLDIVEKEKKLLKEATWRNLALPLPMSVYVHDTQEQAKYKSSLIQASFRKARETWTHKLHKDDNETPFISTPKAQPLKDRSNETPLIYATAMHLPKSSSADPDEESTPAKRMRLSPRQPISGPLQRKQRLSAGQSPSLSLLDTPIVKRKSYRENHTSSVIGTPTSILKVRSFNRQSVSPTCTTPEHLEADTDVDVDVVPLDVTRHRSPLGVSPRRPISRTPRPAVHFEDVVRPSSRSSDGSRSDTSAGQQHLEVLIEVHREQTPLPNSRDSSRSTDDVFYSPDASVSDTVKNEDIIQVDVSQDVRRSLKRKASVQPRRSYKATTPVEVAKSLPVIISEPSVKSAEPSPLTPNSRKSDAFPKLGARRSLSRQVLEHNTLAKVMNTPRLSLNPHGNEKTVGVEVSYSKTVTSIVKKSSDTATEENCDRSTVEMKNIFSTETENSKQIIKHIHNETTSKSSVKKLTEVLDEETSEDRQSLEDSFASCAAEKAESNNRVLSFSSDVGDSYFEKQKLEVPADETINNTIANEDIRVEQTIIEENNETNVDVSMEEITEQLKIHKEKRANLTETVFEDISSIIEDNFEEDMETSQEQDPVDESVVNIEESKIEQEATNKKATQEESIVNIEDSTVEDEAREKSIQEETAANKDNTHEESFVNIEESSKDSSETEKLSNQYSDDSSDNENIQTEQMHEESSQEASSVASSQPKNYLVPSSEEESDEDEKLSNQDEQNEKEVKFVYEEIEEEQEVENPEESEEESHSESESDNSSHSSDVIEIQSSSEDSDEFKLKVNTSEENEDKLEEAEEELDEEETEEEHIFGENLITEQDNILEQNIEMQENREQNNTYEPTSIAEEVVQMEEEIQNTETIQECVEQEENSVDIPEDIQQEIEECIQEEELQLQESSKEELQLQESSKGEIQLQQLQESCIEEIQFHESSKMENKAKDSSKSDVSQDCLETMSFTTSEEQLQQTDFLCNENPTQQILEWMEPEPETSTQIDKEIGTDLIENFTEKQREKEETYTPSRRSMRISSKQDVITEEEPKLPGRITRTRSMSVDNEEKLTKLETKVTRKRSTSVDIERIEEPMKPTRASTRKRSTSVDVEELKPARSSTRRRSTNIDVEDLTLASRRQRSTSVDVEEDKPVGRTRKQSTSVDVEDLTLASRRQRSTSVDVEEDKPVGRIRKQSTSVDVEEDKPAGRIRTRSTSVDVEEGTPAVRITRKRSTSVGIEEKPAPRTRKRSTSTDVEESSVDVSKRSTRASSVVNLPVIPEEINRNIRASSLEPKSSQSPARRGRKRSIQQDIVPEETSSALENIPEKIEDYSATHRLTRRQKVMMEKSLEMQVMKKLQPQEPKPRIEKIEEDLPASPELEESPMSPSSVSTDTQSIDAGTPRRRGSRRLSTPSTPTRRSTRTSRESRDTADDASSVRSVPIVKVDRRDVVRYRSLSPTTLKEPESAIGRKKSTRNSILPVQTDLSKISEETNLENESAEEPTSSQETRPKRGRPKKLKVKEDPPSQSSKNQEIKSKERPTSYRPLEEYARYSAFKTRKSFKIKKLTRK